MPAAVVTPSLVLVAWVFPVPEKSPASASAPSGAARIFRYYDDHVAIVRDSAARTKIESECALLLFFAKKVGKIKSKYDELVLVTYLSGAGRPQGHKLFATLKHKTGIHLT